MADDIFGDASAGIGAVADIFGGLEGAAGQKKAAKAYGQAATLAGENADVAARSGAIAVGQARRQIFQTVSTQTADIAANGLTSGGSNQYLRRASIQQGGVTTSLIANNAKLQVQGFQAEEAADIGQQGMAEAQAQASAGGGFLGAVGKILSIF